MGLEVSWELFQKRYGQATVAESKYTKKKIQKSKNKCLQMKVLSQLHSMSPSKLTFMATLALLTILASAAAGNISLATGSSYPVNHTYISLSSSATVNYGSFGYTWQRVRNTTSYNKFGEDWHYTYPYDSSFYCKAHCPAYSIPVSVGSNGNERFYCQRTSPYFNNVTQNSGAPYESLCIPNIEGNFCDLPTNLLNTIQTVCSFNPPTTKKPYTPYYPASGYDCCFNTGSAINEFTDVGAYIL